MRPDATDYGAQPWRVVKEDAPDPDAPNRTIRRARRHDPLRHIDLEPALFVAAERYREVWALSEGAREGVGNVRLNPWQRCHYEVRRADARAEMLACRQAVGQILDVPFRAAVEDCMKIEEIEKAYRDRGVRLARGRVSAMIREALGRLRDWQTENGR